MTGSASPAHTPTPPPPSPTKPLQICKTLHHHPSSAESCKKRRTFRRGLDFCNFGALFAEVSNNSPTKSAPNLQDLSPASRLLLYMSLEHISIRVSADLETFSQRIY